MKIIWQPFILKTHLYTLLNAELTLTNSEQYIYLNQLLSKLMLVCKNVIVGFFFWFFCPCFDLNPLVRFTWQSKMN